MAETKTVQQLFDFLEQLIHDGKGDLPILFDTEAKRFEYHMARIDRAYHEDTPYPHVQFHEERYEPDHENFGKAVHEP